MKTPTEKYNGFDIYRNEYGWFNVPAINCFSATTLDNARAAIERYAERNGLDRDGVPVLAWHPWQIERFLEHVFCNVYAANARLIAAGALTDEEERGRWDAEDLLRGLLTKRPWLPQGQKTVFGL